MKNWTLALGLAALVFAACSDGSSAPATVPVATTSTLGTTTTTAPAATTITGESTTSTSATTSTTTTTTTLPPPLAAIELDVELVDASFEQPVLATARPGDARLFVVEQAGRVVALDLATGSHTTILDINELVRWKSEQGLLGLAFHPVDPDRFVVHYTANNGSTVVEEYRIDPATGLGDRSSVRPIFGASQPAVNHNGGMIAFGPDGYLYVGLGDGGGSNDTYDNGQDRFSPLGSILRLDIDAGDPYAIPPDNPFADGSEGDPEIWAWGLRNPWRFSFDGSDLWVGDVGQGAWEEIDLFDARVPGTNAGWPLLEGLHCFRFSNCDPEAFLSPVIEYRHQNGRCSVTGGAVYRGTAIPDLVGTYLYGDYCTGEVWGLRIGETLDQRLFTDPDDVYLPRLWGLTSFGVGPDGELYVMQASGQLWRFVGV